MLAVAVNYGQTCSVIIWNNRSQGGPVRRVCLMGDGAYQEIRTMTTRQFKRYLEQADEQDGIEDQRTVWRHIRFLAVLAYLALL